MTRQSDLEAGPEWLALLAAVKSLPGGIAIAEGLSALQERVAKLEKRDAGWRK